MEPAGKRRLDVEFQRVFARARVARESDLPVRAGHDIGVDAVDAIFKTVAQIGEDNSAIGDLHTIDSEIIRGGVAGRGRRLGSIVDARVALAPQRDIQNRLVNDEFADLRMTGQHAAQRDVGLHAADGETAVGSRGPWGPAR